MEGRQLTGRTVLIIALSVFGLIIAVNVTLATFAVSTFSGLIVPNSYVASQSFDDRRAAQETLGWTADVAYDDGEVRLALRDAGGSVVRPEHIIMTVGRPTHQREDRTVLPEAVPSGYASSFELGPGLWRVEISARAADGTEFEQNHQVYVSAP